MNTFILSAETAQWSISHLLQQVNDEGVEIKDLEGNVVAIVLPASNAEATMHAEIDRELREHRAEIKEALSRRGGITTAELLRRVKAAAEQQGL